MRAHGYLVDTAMIFFSKDRELTHQTAIKPPILLYYNSSAAAADSTSAIIFDNL